MTDGHAAIAIASGIVTGLFLRSKLFNGVAHVYEDQQFWEVPAETDEEKHDQSLLGPSRIRATNNKVSPL